MILLATRSAGKLRELRPLFASAGLETIDLPGIGIDELADEDAIEAFESFEENALAKARHFARLTGLSTVADDSGLEVSALGGGPGVRSKRFSGRTDLRGRELDAANSDKLQEALRGARDRTARFVCAAALVGSDGSELVRRGETAGVILREPRGVEGFGYDPWFGSVELGGRTFAEAGVAEKETVSHRGRAFRALLAAYVAVDRGGACR